MLLRADGSKMRFAQMTVFGPSKGSSVTLVVSLLDILVIEFQFRSFHKPVQRTRTFSWNPFIRGKTSLLRHDSWQPPRRIV